MGRDLKARATGNVQQQQDAPPSLSKQIASMQTELQRAMPKGTEAVQLVRDAQTALRVVKDLAKCDEATVLGGLMTCAQLGLRVGVLGQAWLLPYWDSKTRGHKAQLIIGYQGLLELIYRSDMVETVAARTVYENDEWLLEYGLGEDKLIHRPPTGWADRGAPVGYYAIARMKSGGYQMTDPVSVADMEKHRDRHAPRNRNQQIVGPWRDHFDSMALKTMIIRLAKTLPKSPEVMRAIENDGAVRADRTAAAIDHPNVVEGEFTVDEPDSSTPSAQPVDNETGDNDAPPPAENTETLTRQELVAHQLAEMGVNDADNVAGWLQQALGDPDAPKVPADLDDAEASQVLEAIAASK
ncbi:RecT-like DNA pairing protein [Gordonia phage Leonard]|uniref:RecT-like DNA pairing protein n=1 Tax=Gordonia phage Leonard TaxID=2656539 RepID=A0A649VME2_9CAUD|nr:RecT-like ssDNA annealing protein [Gordonia phage Phinally]YP_010002268.1 RecT-like ssDNA annealing protein [Gordonia phage Leonard]AMS03041.1 RecT-like DNA pairing protein [Gordonia phage Phinally]QGJ93411.1 RecT-like DNA pairing protein [Gordonia phage Leonard]